MAVILKNKKGFTLLEIIVVMIIVGVIAAIALPNLFANVERQRINEALGIIPSIRTAVDACVAQTNGLFAQATCGMAGNVVPATSSLNVTVAPQANTFFTYTTAAIANGYSITATRLALNTLAAPPPAVTGDGIALQVNTTTNVVTRQVVDNGTAAAAPGTGTFAGVW